jgi:hypothetical protein
MKGYAIFGFDREFVATNRESVGVKLVESGPQNYVRPRRPILTYDLSQGGEKKIHFLGKFMSLIA